MLSVFLFFSVSLLQCFPSPVHNECRNGSPGTWPKQSHLASLYLDTKFVSLHNHLLHDTLLNGFLVFVSRLNDNKKSNSLNGLLENLQKGLKTNFVFSMEMVYIPKKVTRLCTSR